MYFFRTFRWFIGSVVFFYKHNNSLCEENSQFLVLVKVMKDHSTATYDPTLPVVKKHGEQQNARYAVISLNDVKHQVGLVQSSENSLEYKVVAPYYIFRENVKKTAGRLQNI